jgi:hypothetical protein
MNQGLDPAVKRSLEDLTLDARRPMIVCDADEVLFAFMASFERFLHQCDHYFVWRSYMLDGNVRRRADHESVDPATVQALLARFWMERAEALEPIPGAAQALAALAAHATILVLTNVPPEHSGARQRALRRHGLPYPGIANIGPKGPALGWLAERIEAPIYFVDDSPKHHASAATHADRSVRIHFVGDRRLAGLLAPAAHSHYRIDTWAALGPVLARQIGVRT